MRSRAGSRSDQDVEAEVFQSRIQDLFDVRHQPVDLIDEEDLPLGHRGKDAGQVEFLLKNWAGSLLECRAQFVRDDCR